MHAQMYEVCSHMGHNITACDMNTFSAPQQLYYYSPSTLFLECCELYIELSGEAAFEPPHLT